MLRAIILEDDILSSLDYEIIINDLGIALDGTYKSWKDAIPKIKNNLPDFMVVDLNLSQNEKGLDFLCEMQDFFIPTIIVSGFLKPDIVDFVIDKNVIAIIPKPLDKTLFTFHLKKLLLELNNKDDTNHLIIKDNKRLIKIPHSEIILIEIDGNYSVISLESGKKFVIKMSLTKVIEKLNSNSFLRCHRSNLVNIDKVCSLDLSTNLLKLPQGIEAKIGAKYRSHIKKVFQSNRYFGSIIETSGLRQY